MKIPHPFDLAHSPSSTCKQIHSDIFRHVEKSWLLPGSLEVRVELYARKIIGEKNREFKHFQFIFTLFCNLQRKRL